MVRTISRSNLASAPLVAFAALIAGAMAVQSAQLAVTGTLLLLIFSVRLESRSAGLALLWTYWLLVPGIRRVVDLIAPSPAADPLSLLPFLCTGLLAVMELRENRLTRRGRTILSLAGIGFLLGVPVGLSVDPAATSFAALAYLAGLSAFVIGWGDEAREESGITLERTVLAVLVPLSLYGIAQYFWPLTAWDDNWVDATDLGSIMAPQEGHIRIFSTLNSPFTFAILLAVGLLFAISQRRRFSSAALFMLAPIVALALTFVRSAWLSLAIGLLVYAAAARGRAAGKIVAIVLLCIVGVIFLGSSNPTTKAFTDRITSLGDPEDISAKERLETTKRLLPQSVRQPAGAGLGQAGLASNLSESKESGVVDVDNGYVSLIYQVGPLGFLLVVGAMFVCAGAAYRAVGRSPPEARFHRAAILAIVVMLLVAQASADVLFGLPAVIFWYLAGISVAAGSGRRVTAPAEAATAPINRFEPSLARS